MKFRNSASCYRIKELAEFDGWPSLSSSRKKDGKQKRSKFEEKSGQLWVYLSLVIGLAGWKTSFIIKFMKAVERDKSCYVGLKKEI